MTTILPALKPSTPEESASARTVRLKVHLQRGGQPVPGWFAIDVSSP